MAAATFMSLDVHHWTRLCTLLDSAIESEKPSPDLINRIDNALEAGRPQLEDLLVYPTPHPSDAEALKSGKAIPWLDTRQLKLYNDKQAPYISPVNLQVENRSGRS